MRTVRNREKARGMQAGMLNALPPSPQDSLSSSKNPKNEFITHTDAIVPPLVSRSQRQIMNVPFSFHSPQASYNASLLQFFHKSLASSKRRDLVSIRMNYKCRHSVPSRSKLRHRTDGLDSFQRRRAGKRS